MLALRLARQSLQACSSGRFAAPLASAAPLFADRTAEAARSFSRAPKGPLSLEENGGLLEYSVVYTDRAVNHMSTTFQQTMNDINRIFKKVYNAHKVVVLAGSGTYAMEAVARQLVTDQKALVIRNGYFSYRWSDIFTQSGIPSEAVVVNGQPTEVDRQPHFAPPPIADMVARIKAEKPAVVFAPHVETSTGIMLPDDYVKQVADAAHSVGGLFVLDCIASGTAFVDMKATGVDVIITAPQKGWSGPACCGIALLSEAATEKVNNTTSTSLVLNLRKWLEHMDAYENGGFMYYATMPTDAVIQFRDVAVETEEYGFDRVKSEFMKMGKDIRAMMASKGLKSVAAPGFEAPGVVVSYISDPDMFAKFRKEGFQIAGGVPFMINEPEGNFTFRIGLFGLDKVMDAKKTSDVLEVGLDKVLATVQQPVEQAA